LTFNGRRPKFPQKHIYISNNRSNESYFSACRFEEALPGKVHRGTPGALNALGSLAHLNQERTPSFPNDIERELFSWRIIMKKNHRMISFGSCFFCFFLLPFFLFPSIAYPAPSAYYDTVQKIYIGYYQRPADPAGLIYWAERLDDSNGNLNEIVEAFASSDEAQALYGAINSSNIATVINEIYNALFGRDAEIAGRDWYVAEFNAGRFTAATIMLNVLYGAQDSDLQSATSKLTASNLFTKTIDPELDNSNFLATYAGNSDAIAARNFLALYATSSQVPTQEETTAYIKEYIADSGDDILSDSGDDEDDLDGLWSVRLTDSVAAPTTVVRYVYFSQSNAETVCLIEIDGETTVNNVTVSGNNITTSWTEGAGIPHKTCQ